MTQRGDPKRTLLSAALCRAVAAGGVDMGQIKVGRLGTGPGPQVDMEEIMERSLAILRGEDAAMLSGLSWTATCHNQCDNPEWNYHGPFVASTRSCNPVLVHTQPDTPPNPY